MQPTRIVPKYSTMLRKNDQHQYRLRQGVYKWRDATYVQMPTLVINQVKSGSVKSGIRSATPTAAIAHVLFYYLVSAHCL
jgi:hypothetical protein